MAKTRLCILGGGWRIGLFVATPVNPGEVLLGKYRVERVIAQGGMGVVIEAMHLSLERTVALKFMLPDMASQRDAVIRFEREARAVARLRTEHVSRILDVGQLESGLPFIALEYLDGEDLGAILGRGELPELGEGVEYILQTSEALAEAHALGIIHRDVKPENIFVTRRCDGSPLVKLLDFGISKVPPRSPQDRAHETTQEVMGSPTYMAPEQLISTADVDARADIWSLGAILYEIACGRPPFEADKVMQLCVRVMHEPHVPLDARMPGLPPGFSDVVDRCLQKDRDRRFSTLTELALALEPFAPERAKVTVDRIVGMSGEVPERYPARESQPRHAGSRTAVAWGNHAPLDAGARAFAIVGVVGLVVTAVYASLREPIADARSIARSGLEDAAATAQSHAVDSAMAVDDEGDAPIAPAASAPNDEPQPPPVDPGSEPASPDPADADSAPRRDERARAPSTPTPPARRPPRAPAPRAPAAPPERTPPPPPVEEDVYGVRK